MRAPRSSVTGSISRWREAISVSALSMDSGVGSARSRVSAMAPKSGIGTSGNSSTSTLNARSCLSPGEVTSTFGCVAGRSPRSDSTCCVAELTLSSSTSELMAEPKRWPTTVSGTLPGRKPGRRTVLPTSASFAVRLLSMSAMGTTTA